MDGDKVYSQSYQGEIFKLVQKGIGGFIIFGGEMNDTRSFIDKLQSMSETPLFIASDIERGVGQQIKGGTIFPCQMAVRAAVRKDRPEDVSFLRDVIKAIAYEAIDVGINMPLIPVLDVNQNPDNPIICTRAFSDEPEDVAWFGAEYIKNLGGYGLISCAKHFPGHGDTSTDSHISLPVITKSYKDLMNIDVIPFVKAIKNGVSSIMVGHMHIPAIDSIPASLSKKVVKELLRDKLGFNGLILTDALNMSALNGIKNVHAKCINAAVDILLHPMDADISVKELENAIRSKEIDEESIESALKRILNAKAKLSGIKKAGVDYNRSRNLSALLTDMSITIVKDSAVVSSAANNGSIVLAGDVKFHNPVLWKESFKDVSTINDAAYQYKGLVIIVVFSDVSAWMGSSGIENDEKQRIIELIKRTKNSIVISFGSPYILSHFKDADMLIAAYGATEQSQKAVIKCLKGEMGCKGNMPVRV